MRRRPGPHSQGLKTAKRLPQKVFFLRYQRNGSARHFALGAYPEMSSAEALKKAAEWRKKNRRRHRPFRRAKNKCMAVQHQSLTVEELVFKWIDFNVARGCWADASRPRDELWLGYLRNHVPANGGQSARNRSIDRHLSDSRRADVPQAHQDLKRYALEGCRSDRLGKHHSNQQLRDHRADHSERQKHKKINRQSEPPEFIKRAMRKRVARDD